MPALLVAGALTRDQIQIDGDRWPQPGGAPWHAGLALAGTLPADQLQLLGQAGPWATRFALPALAAAGLDIRPAASGSDTIFVNEYRPQRRFQRLIDRARPLAATDLPSGPIQAAAVSPLYLDALAPDLIPALRERGAFVALDAQGLLRRIGPGGLVETVAPPDLVHRFAGVRALKLSVREFDVVPAAGRSHDVPGTIFAATAGVELLITHGAAGAQLFLPGGGSIDARRPAHTAPTADATPSTLDTTGAGDIFLATYAHARGQGLTPAESLHQATAAATATIERRRHAATDRRGLIEPLRSLHASATWVARRVPLRHAPSADAALFPHDGPLAQALAPHFPQPLSGQAATSAQRAPAQVGACWALLARGWPSDPALTPAALRQIAAAQLVAASRVRAALIA